MTTYEKMLQDRAEVEQGIAWIRWAIANTPDELNTPQLEKFRKNVMRDMLTAVEQLTRVIHRTEMQLMAETAAALDVIGQEYCIILDTIELKF